MSGRAMIQIHATPPSFNSTRYAHWRKVKRATDEWAMRILVEIQKARIPRGVERVQAEALMRFPTRRRRDEGNFRVTIEKALGDVLVAQRIIPDDTRDRYRFLSVDFVEKPGPNWTRIDIEWEGGPGS